MIYVDTSVLVAMHTRESGTRAAQDWYARLDDTPLCSAAWAATEFASALSIKRRTNQLTTRQAGQTWRQFRSLCSADLRLLPVNSEAFQDAASLVLDSTSGLRAGDALHLAVALQVKANAVATFDTVMRVEAGKLGMRLIEFEARA